MKQILTLLENIYCINICITLHCKYDQLLYGHGQKKQFQKY